jgi:hypothetical protein
VITSTTTQSSWCADTPEKRMAPLPLPSSSTASLIPPPLLAGDDAPLL